MILKNPRPLRKDECLRIAFLFYGIGTGHRIERLTKSGHWVPEICGRNAICKKPWMHRIVESSSRWASSETLRKLIADAEAAESSHDAMTLRDTRLMRGSEEVERMKMENARLLRELKKANETINALRKKESK